MEDFLYMLHDDGDIDDEELLLLMPIHRRNLHVGLPYSSYDRFDIFDVREDECEVEFRFKKEDIFRFAGRWKSNNFLENFSITLKFF